MSNQETEMQANLGWFSRFKQLIMSIGTKIILPYLLLTVAVAGIGAFIVTNLVTSTFQERFNNQLLDAGRIVAEMMVGYELERLETLRTVAATQGVSTAIVNNDFAALQELVNPILGNEDVEAAVEVINANGQEVYGWQRPPDQNNKIGEERRGADYSQVAEVQRVLDGFVDDFGEKRVLIGDTSQGKMIFTVGPVYEDNEIVGAVLIGTYLDEMVKDMTQTALARVTLYNQAGNVIATTLGSGQQAITESLDTDETYYPTVIAVLQESPKQLPVVSAQNEVPLKEVEILNQNYTLAFGDWRIRNQSFGLFSVALTRNFILQTAAKSRTALSILFFVATIAVFGIGWFIAQRIIQPLNQLVRTSLVVSQGNLEERTSIERSDEIGTLAHSFDVMTENLQARNRRLVEQASELETILNSIADGVMVMDNEGNIITSNPAASAILEHMSEAMQANLLQELPPTNGAQALDEKTDLTVSQSTPKRYRVGNRVYSALDSPMITPQGEQLGTVVALRDITREAEAENLQDGFITSVSHELRTPLTAIKGYSDILLKVSKTGLNETHLPFIEKINSNVDRLIHHTNKLIDISQIQAGTLAIRQEPVQLSVLIQSIATKWRPQILDRNLEFELELTENDTMIKGDWERLGWAIENLVQNAYNYTLNGKICLRLSRKNEEVQLDVIDSGVGIAMVDQPYLFSRFFRAHNNHEFTFNVDGVGLGLYITKAVIELHGGRIWAESKVEEGSVFSFALPHLKV